MAQKVRTFLVDDLDGGDAEGTILFGLDGAQYEIDLSAGHAEELRTTLARYIGAGRKVTGTARRAGQNGRKAPASSISSITTTTTPSYAYGPKLKGWESKSAAGSQLTSSPGTGRLQASSSTAARGPVRPSCSVRCGLAGRAFREGCRPSGHVEPGRPRLSFRRSRGKRCRRGPGSWQRRARGPAMDP